MKERAVGYVRVSSKDQEREGFSIPAQKHLLKDYAAKQNLHLVKIFEEVETAKKAGRTEFKKMLRFLEEHEEIKHLLAEKTDRLYRNFKDYSILDIDNSGRKFHLIKEGEVLSRDSKSSQKFVHGIKVLMAKNYIDNLSEEVIKGQAQKAKQGTWPSVAPIGYYNRLEDRSIQVDPVAGPLIRKAFELAATGNYSLSKLKRELYAHGLRSRRAGNELGKQAMARVLQNRFYLGEFVWGKQKYKGDHEPLIELKTFELVQAVMGFGPRPYKSRHDFAFSGLMTCGHCGCSITPELKRKKSGKTYTYYHCTNGKGSCSNVVYLPEEKVEDALQMALNQIKLSSEVIEWSREALLASADQEREFREAKVKSLTTRYKKLESYVSVAYEDRLEGRIELDMWERKTAEWKAEQEGIQTELSALNKASTSYMLEGVRLMELAHRSGQLFKSMTNDEKREILKLTLSNPRVVNGTVEYDYKKPFSMFVNVVNLEKWRGTLSKP